MILINCLSALQGGGQTYLAHLFSHLPQNMQSRVIILANVHNASLWRDFRIRMISVKWASRSILHRVLFENSVLPCLFYTEGIEVYVSPAGLLPFRHLEGVKTVTIFQNLLPFAPTERRRYPLGYTRLRLSLLRIVQARSFQRADAVIFISRYAQQVISQIVSHRKGQSVVIPHGLSDDFRYQGDRPAFPKGLSGEYVLYVSILDVYKAQLELIHAWHLVRQRRATSEKLVLIGPEYPYYARKVRALIHALHLENEVLLLGKVPYEELPAYYQHAKINLFASSCENCPNILLEALAAGQPVLCSNYAPMPEFGGDAVEYFDPYVPDELARLLLKYLDDDHGRAELGRKALQQSLRFDWKKTAEKTWNLLAELLETH